MNATLPSDQTRGRANAVNEAACERMRPTEDEHVTSTADRAVDVLFLYSKDMNIYGDFGNLLTIRRRLALYGYDARLHFYNPGDDWPDHVDLILGGGGQDLGQKMICEDLSARADSLRSLVRAGTPALVVCGLYQLFGHFFESIDGTRMEGIGIFDAYTIGQADRLIGNVVEQSSQFGEIIGYENHSGQTFLEEGATPLGEVDRESMGNNGVDRTEGARAFNAIGTYLHGSLLPKNPLVADFLIRTAIERRYGRFAPKQIEEQRRELQLLDDLAQRARSVAAHRPR
ncbi:type 1 glutamine amidotransferase [Coriobacterium glomerans]|nr:glutamine amidotransferase [Coriobacterium glomerans]